MPVLPVITCRFTDKYGSILDPFSANAICYKELTLAQRRPEIKRPSINEDSAYRLVAFSIEGFITVFANNQSISPPVPFCIVKKLILAAPDRAFLQFATEGFRCRACVTFKEDSTTYDTIHIFVRIQTSVICEALVGFPIPEPDTDDKPIHRVCTHTQQVFDSIIIKSQTCIKYRYLNAKAKVSQYIARADGKKRVYTNGDELKEYGDHGILSPKEVSIYNLFVNGVPQPKKNYKLENGHLIFTTTDVPGDGQPITIAYVTFECKYAIDVVTLDYCAVSDGKKRTFTDADSLPEYSDSGIPAPEEVSYFNLYVNGVLQPRVNFSVKKSFLFLETSDLPKKNEPILLESYVIRNKCGKLLTAEAEQYIARSNGGKVYTNRDSLKEYGNGKIEDPSCSSFQNLFVNGTIQPDVNFRDHEGCLVLTSEDSPKKSEPISLESVTVYI